MTALLPEGLRDRLPPHADAAAAIEARVLAAVGLHGYERVDPPLAEYAESLATRLKDGGLTDAVRFVDPVSQRTLAVRPDLTAQVARVAATRMAHHPRPVRLSYAGSILKLRGGQLSPARELRQIGAELIGLDSVAAAREVVTVAVEALEAAGVSGVSIDFTLPDLVDALAAGPMPVAADQLAVLREQEGGMKTADVCRKHGISSATLYAWKAKYGGMDVSEARRLKALEEENAKLKRMLADSMLDNVALKDLLGKKW